VWHHPAHVVVHDSVSVLPDVEARGDADIMAVLLRLVDGLMMSRLDLNMNLGHESNETQPELLRANLKARIQAKFPFALSAAEWCHEHCLWTALPRVAQRACVSSAATLVGVSTAFTTLVRRTGGCDMTYLPFSPPLLCGCTATMQITRTVGGEELVQCRVQTKELSVVSRPVVGATAVVLRSSTSVLEAIERLKARIAHSDSDDALVSMMVHLAEVRH